MESVLANRAQAHNSFGGVDSLDAGGMYDQGGGSFGGGTSFGGGSMYESPDQVAAIRRASMNAQMAGALQQQDAQRRASMSVMGAVNLSSRDQNVLKTMIEEKRKRSKQMLSMIALVFLVVCLMAVVVSQMSQTADLQSRLDRLEGRSSSTGGTTTGGTTTGTGSTSLTSLQSSILQLETAVATKADAGALATLESTTTDALAALDTRVAATELADGTAQNRAARSCAAIKAAAPASTDGLYWIDAGAGQASNSPGAFQVFCDMTRDGGGWTLVMMNNGPIASGSYTWAGSVYGVATPAGRLSNDLSTADVLVGLAWWAGIGTEGRVELGDVPGVPENQATYSTLTVDCSDLCRLDIQGETITLGATSLGIFSGHNGKPWTTCDSDNDEYPANCSASYGCVPWWYTACWSGNLWGSSSGASYTPNAYITGSTLYKLWGAIWLR